MINTYKFIELSDGTQLNAKIKEHGRPYWLIATHGIGEHCGRHEYIHDLFGHDFNIFQYDLRGHGLSMGERAYVNDFDQYMQDLNEILHFLKSKYKMKKYVLFAHSMGALINAGFLQKHAKKSFYPECVFLSSPPAGVGGILGEVVNRIPAPLFEGLSKFHFSIKLRGLVDHSYLSHDARIADEYMRDEQNCKSLHTKLLLELVACAKDVFSMPINPKCPTFCTVGGEDKIVSPQVLEDYFEYVEKSVEFKIFDGAYHEIHNEVEKYRSPYFDYLKKCILETIYPAKEAKPVDDFA